MKTGRRIAVHAALAALVVYGSVGTAEAGGHGIYGPGGCTTKLPLFPTPGGAAPPCETFTAANAIVLPTDGNVQYVGSGIDDGPSVTPGLPGNPYAFNAVGFPSGIFPAQLTATIPSYSEPCVGSVFPPFGIANGLLNVGIPSSATSHFGFPFDSAVVSTDYAWVRVGVIAVIRTGILAGGSGVVDFAIGPDDTGVVAAGAIAAFFVPVPPFGTCAAPGPLEMHLVVTGGYNVLVG